MKVVAIIPQQYGSDKMLVELTEVELGFIATGRQIQLAPRIGTEVNVGTHWRRVQDIDTAQAGLNNAASSLRSLASLLETIPVVVPPPEPEPAKEGGAA